MTRELFYFSGTGNSLAVARDIANTIEARLTPIPAVMNIDSLEITADVLGIVCPAYYMRIPRIVERFIGRLTDLQSKYIFAVVTVGGIAGGVLPRLSEAISQRGGTLAAGFIVRMPANYIHDADALPLSLQKRMFRKSQGRATEIAIYVLEAGSGRMEKSNPVMTPLFTRSIEKKYWRGELDPAIDENFWTDDKCNGCGICEMVCPVGNIDMVDGRPVWRHACEKCLACIQWCPRESVQFKDVTLSRRRYHHPDVNLSDMLRRSG